MKRLFTLLGLLALAATINAQLINNQGLSLPNPGLKKAYPANHVSKPVHHAGNRTSANAQFLIDYDAYDASYANFYGFGYNQSLFNINRRYPLDSTGNGRFALMFYDSLIDYYDNTVWPHDKIPYSACDSITIDSLLFYIAHIKNSSSAFKDTLRLRIYNGNPNVTMLSRDSGFLGSYLWEYVQVIDTTLTGPGSQPGTYMVKSVEIPVGLLINPAHRFAIQADFFGPLQDEFYLLAGFRNDCGSCVASVSSVPSYIPFTGLPKWNSMVNYALGTANPYVFSNELFYPGGGTCPTSTMADPAVCNYDYTQNINMLPLVTVHANLGATISADSVKGCPGTVLTLTANGFGSPNPPYTYSWSAPSGTFSTTTDQTVSYIIGNSTTVTVTVTDANNQTATGTILISSKGITVTISNSNPFMIPCGGTGTITTSLTGVQTGKNYSWSNSSTGPQTGANIFQVTVNAPGTYTVTVTNNQGCSSTASVNVTLPGVSNTVNFSFPPPVCQNKPETFINNSTQTGAGWTSTWDPLNDGNTFSMLNLTYTYTTPGVYTCKLTMDSAGCSFSTTRTVNVLVSSNPQCVSIGIDDIEFGNAITLQPNPSYGLLTLTVNGAEKNLSVKVYNIIGSEVKNFAADDVSSLFVKTFDFNELPSGTYRMKIENGAKAAVKRFNIDR